MKARPHDGIPPLFILFLAGLISAAWPAAAAAQGFGLGPRLSIVRGDVASQTESSRLLGGMVRMASSSRVAIEVAADTRSERSDDGLQRIRERPLQGSLLLFPARAAFSPYVLVGYGLYNQTVETLDLAGAVVSSESTRRTGAHLGFGAELFLGRHAAFVVDYRYRFVKLGGNEEDDSPVNLPGLGSRLTHRGTMWTTGFAFYF